MSTIAKLLALQDLEFELAALRRQSVEAQNRLGESSALKKARQELEQAENTYQDLCSQQQSLEWQSEDFKSKLQVVNEQLYSGRVKNPKELTNLQREAEIFSANLAKTEEEALLVMEKTEGMTDELELARKNMQQAEEEWTEEQGRLKKEIEKNRQKMTSLQEKHAQLKPTIDAGTMRIYERLKQQRGSAVARVVQGSCEGCHLSLSSAQLQRSRGDSMEKCANCGRILFSE